MNNNAIRGVIFGISLVGMAVMLLMIIDSGSADSGDQLTSEDMAAVIGAGFIMLSCAVMGAGALIGLKLPDSKPKQVVFPYQQGAAQQQQAQPYPQQQYDPQHYGQAQPYDQQQYAQPQQYAQHPQQPQQPQE
jgi:hypothetical protein